MSNGISGGNDYRRRRVQRLKKFIVGLLATLVLLPYLICAILFAKVEALRRLAESLGAMTEDLSRQLEDLSGQMEALSNGLGQWIQPQGDAAPDASLQENLGQPGAEEAQPTHMVYLTFDDGPSIYTGEILDILARYDVKATFFVVGKEDKASREALQRIVDEGHTLGMHSYSHKYTQIYASVDAFAQDFGKLRQFLYEAVGEQSVYYRFPGGSSNSVGTVNMREFADYLKTQGVTFYDWNIASGDATSNPVSKEDLVRNSLKGIERWHTSIILMHDSADKYGTVEALPEIIENILAMEDTVILPITEDTKPVQHIHTDID